MPAMKPHVLAILLSIPAAASAQNAVSPAAPTLASPAIVSGVGEPIAAADLDGDGRPDLITRWNGDILVYMGDASGQLQPPIRSTIGACDLTARVSSQPTVALGDVNQDGRLDAAAIVPGGIAVALGDGAGHFGSVTIVATPAAPYGVALADMNRDGVLDLVVLSGNGRNVSVLLGDGSGGFRPIAQAPVAGADFMIVADVTGDGNPDVVVDTGHGAYTWLLTGDGHGLLPTAEILSSGFTSAVAADFNEDGVPDLVLNGPSLAVLAGGSGLHDSALAPRLPSGISGINVTAMAAGDLNGDGHLDLAMVNEDGDILAALGDGHGHFSAFTRAAVANRGAVTWAVSIVDVDGDGAGDIVAGALSTCTPDAALGCSSGDGSLALYRPASTDVARTTEGLVKALDANFASVANVFTSTAVSLDRLTAVDFGKLAALDATVSSRASQASVDQVAGQVSALAATLVTQPAAGALQSAIADTGMSTRSSIDAASAAATRIAIERALADGVSIVWFTLPASANGQLDTVREIVADSIAGLQSIGVKVGKAAAAAFAKAEAFFASGEYLKAYAWYSTAYQGLR
jgi:hypothetical protein